jgi:uncharacterized protein YoxC
MQVNGGETASPGPEQAMDSALHEQPWASFEKTVENIVHVPLERVQQKVTGATQDLTRKVEDLLGLQRIFEDDVQRSLSQFSAELAELADRVATTSDGATRDRAALGAAVARLADQVDGAIVALGARLDSGAGTLKQEIDKAASRLAAQIQQSQTELQAAQMQELASQVGPLGSSLQAIEAQVRAAQELTNSRLDSAVATLRDALGNEVSAASRQSSDADDALVRSLTRLRRMSYALLALLTVLAAGLLVIAVGS